MILFSSIVLFIYSLDRISKYFALKYLDPEISIPFVKNVFHLTLVKNTGAAFGLFRTKTHFLILITIASAVFIALFLILKRKGLDTLEKTAFSFILAGALGNLTDRLFLGYVVDFLDFRVWPVFNVADSFITVGVGILIISMLVKSRTKTNQ